MASEDPFLQRSENALPAKAGRQRCDLNGCVGELVGPVAKVVGKPVRWRVKVASEIVGMRLSVVMKGMFRGR